MCLNFWYLPKIEELRGHKVVPIMLHKYDILLLFNLQWRMTAWWVLKAVKLWGFKHLNFVTSRFFFTWPFTTFLFILLLQPNQICVDNLAKYWLSFTPTGSIFNCSVNQICVDNLAKYWLSFTLTGSIFNCSVKWDEGILLIKV